MSEPTTVCTRCGTEKPLTGYCNSGKCNRRVRRCHERQR